MASTGPAPDQTGTAHVPDMGPLVEEFRPRAWAKWVSVAIFAPLAVAGFGLAVAVAIALVALPDVPLQMALIAIGFGLVLGGVGVWVAFRSWSWLGHQVEVRREGMVVRWRNQVEHRRWTEIGEVREWSAKIKGREMPHLTVHFADGSKWEFDEEYPAYERLRALIVARGRG